MFSSLCRFKYYLVLKATSVRVAYGNQICNEKIVYFAMKPKRKKKFATDAKEQKEGEEKKKERKSKYAKLIREPDKISRHWHPMNAYTVVRLSSGVICYAIARKTVASVEKNVHRFTRAQLDNFCLLCWQCFPKTVFQNQPIPSDGPRSCFVLVFNAWCALNVSVSAFRSLFFDFSALCVGRGTATTWVKGQWLKH